MYSTFRTVFPGLALVSKSSRLSGVITRSLSTSQGMNARDAKRKFVIDRKRTHPFRMERSQLPNMLEINKRQERAAFDQENRFGAETVPRRSEFIEWNYNAEIAAFQARIGEKFDDDALRQAFVTRHYLETEHLKEKSLGVTAAASGEGDQQSSSSSSSSSSSDDEEDDNDKRHLLSGKDIEYIQQSSNAEMVLKGEDVIEETVKAYVRSALPYLPEEGVTAVHNFLTTDEKLAHVSFHLGTMDLIFCKEYPPSVKTMADTFKSVIWALWTTSQERARRLLVDVLATQLHCQDISDIWDVENPVNVVATLLKNQGKPEPESRMLWVSGQGTIMACYHIGIYCNQELIGQAPGETTEIAEDMAARDALRRMFKFEDASRPLPFSRELAAAGGTASGSNQIKLKLTPNLTIANWSPEKVPETLSVV